MMILLTYDIDSKTSRGRRRLQAIARVCEAAGTRVQHSVFEMHPDPQQLAELKERLEKLIDPAEDSVLIYHLSSRDRERTETLGRSRLMPYDDLLAV